MWLAPSIHRARDRMPRLRPPTRGVLSMLRRLPPSPPNSESVTKNNMHTFVLIHGAFYGGWVWREVLRGLREKGHAPTAPTLAGICERRHLANGMVELSIHVEDVVDHIEMENLQNVVL